MESDFDNLPSGLKSLLTKTFLVIYSGLLTLTAGKAHAGVIEEESTMSLEPDFVARLKNLARKPQLVLKLNMDNLSNSRGMMHTSHSSHSSHSSHYSSSGGHFSHSSHSSHSSHYSSSSYSSPSYSSPSYSTPTYTPRSYTSPKSYSPFSSSGPRYSPRSSRKTRRSRSVRSTYSPLTNYDYGLVPMVYNLGDRALRLGDKGDDVRQLQVLLQAAGHSLTPDGDFGLGTNAAVKEFQVANGLDADGVAGAQTVMLLRAQ